LHASRWSNSFHALSAGSRTAGIVLIPSSVDVQLPTSRLAGVVTGPCACRARIAAQEALSQRGVRSRSVLCHATYHCDVMAERWRRRCAPPTRLFLGAGQRLPKARQPSRSLPPGHLQFARACALPTALRDIVFCLASGDTNMSRAAACARRVPVMRMRA
jgi:hypothetical protein